MFVAGGLLVWVDVGFGFWCDVYVGFVVGVILVLC